MNAASNNESQSQESLRSNHNIGDLLLPQLPLEQGVDALTVSKLNYFPYQRKHF